MKSYKVFLKIYPLCVPAQFHQKIEKCTVSPTHTCIAITGSHGESSWKKQDVSSNPGLFNGLFPKNKIK